MITTSDAKKLLEAHKLGENVLLDIFLDALEEEGLAPPWNWELEYDEMDIKPKHDLFVQGQDCYVYACWLSLDENKRKEGMWWVSSNEFFPGEKEAKRFCVEKLWDKIGRGSYNRIKLAPVAEW